MDYNIIVKVYAANAKVPAILSNSIEFINCGTDYVNVEGVKIAPGGSWQPVQALPGEGDNTQYMLRFSDADTDPWVAVVFKQYIGKRTE